MFQITSWVPLTEWCWKSLVASLRTDLFRLWPWNPLQQCKTWKDVATKWDLSAWFRNGRWEIVDREKMNPRDGCWCDSIARNSIRNTFRASDATVWPTYWCFKLSTRSWFGHVKAKQSSRGMSGWRQSSSIQSCLKQKITGPGGLPRCKERNRGGTCIDSIEETGQQIRRPLLSGDGRHLFTWT